MSRFVAFVLVCMLAGCASAPLVRVPALDLTRYEGDWYVVAHIPTRRERHAYDAIEHYRLREDGTIDVRFTFREGSHEGTEEELDFRAYVRDTTTNAEWRVRPFWPVSLAYVVIYLDADYELTVVGHPSRNYAWVMARSPVVDEAAWRAAEEALVSNGFDLEAVRRVPHAARPPTEHPR